MSSKLFDSVKRVIAMILMVDMVYFWTDSETCLWWIKSVDRGWKTWVESRTNAIHALTNIDSWRLVCGEYNSSDIGIRKGDLVYGS